MKITGNAWKFGDNIDTDMIFPGKYLGLLDPKEIASHCLENADPNFAKKVEAGDIIVARENFGCGSSREAAPQAIKEVGVSCVIAKSFARIFLRSAINIGLTVLESDAVDLISQNDELEIDFCQGHITDVTNGKIIKYRNFPPFMQEIINAGGLVRYAKRKLSTSKTIAK